MSLGAGSGKADDVLGLFEGSGIEGSATDTELHCSGHAGYDFQNDRLVFGPGIATFGTSAEVDPPEGGGSLVLDEDTVTIELGHGVRLCARGGQVFGATSSVERPAPPTPRSGRPPCGPTGPAGAIGAARSGWWATSG